MSGAVIDPQVSSGLGLYFFILGIFNAIFAVRRFGEVKERLARLFDEKEWKTSLTGFVTPIFWALVTIIMFGTALEFYLGHGPVLSQGFRDLMDRVMGPIVYTIVSVVGFAALIYYRKAFSTNLVGWLILDATLILIGFSMTDADFRGIVAKPDNVPISMLIFSVGFLTWLAFRQAVANDERIAAGKPVAEAEGNDKVLTWPDLVYTEMLAMILCTVFLLVWSIFLRAPLEPPASTTEIPNPSKAPWYFLGLQEMLVYFDPWLAGVVLPTYILLGLCAIPYIDYNKKGSGYYTFNERPFAIITFLFGFLVMWVTLIVLGTFLRGPNWNFFGFYEFWSPYKTIAMNNVNLSDLIWLDWLGTGKPSFWLWRELPGIILVLGYFLVIPMVLAKTVCRTLYIKMGLIRYQVMMNILLMMAFLPVKMIFRWVMALKYFVYIPEYFFNI